MPSSVASLDTTGSDDSFDEEEYRLAQEEWEESLEQLQQLVSIVLLPFLGKWLGRRWSHWGMSSFPVLLYVVVLTSHNSLYTLPSFRIRQDLFRGGAQP